MATQLQEPSQVTINDTKIFRYKFSPQVTEMTAEFAKLHVFDSKKQLKECFDEWYIQNEQVFQDDEERLRRLGFETNYQYGLFRSLKYYHIKKIKAGPNTNIVIKKRPIIDTSRWRFSKQFINYIDIAIKRELVNNKTFKPSIHFNQILLTQTEFASLFKNEKDRWIEEANSKNTQFQLKDIADEFDMKIKKMYQNRYYNAVSSCKNV